MTSHELKKLVEFTADLFPGMTAAQASILRDVISAYPKDLAENVIRNHVLRPDGGGRLDLAQLRDAIVGAAEKRSVKRREDVNQKIVDWLRETLPASTSGKSDDLCLTEHFITCWAAVESSQAPAQGIAAERIHIFNDAFQAFLQVGHTQAEASILARDCIGLDEGQKIEMPIEIFKAVPKPQSQRPWGALTALGHAAKAAGETANGMVTA